MPAAKDDEYSEETSRTAAWDAIFGPGAAEVLAPFVNERSGKV